MRIRCAIGVQLAALARVRCARLLLALGLALALASGRAVAEPAGRAGLERGERAEVSERAHARLVESVGPLKNPMYIRSDEVADFEGVKFKPARELQVGRPGQALKLERGQRYLWAIDEHGDFLIAPIEKLAGGKESVGHPQLTGGRPARLGGELHFEGKTWRVDNDSGRWGRDGTVTRAQVRAATEVLRRVGARDEHGAARLRASFFDVSKVPADAESPRIAIIKRLGGYVLRPPRGEGVEGFHGVLKQNGYRTGWHQRAQRELGVAAP